MTPAEKIEYAKREQARALRVIRAYKKVLGLAGARDADQQIVWEHMQENFGLFRPVFLQDKDGALSALRAAHTDGRRSVVIEIAEILAKPLGDNQPTTPVVK